MPKSTWVGLRNPGLSGWKQVPWSRRAWGLAASIAAMVPCLGPCFVLGIPLGIWGVLTAQKMPPELWEER